MIVSCDKCSVKLKVDETKIKEGGSRLRCPKCQNIFTVYRPQELAAAPPSRPPAPAPPEAPARQEAPAPPPRQPAPAPPEAPARHEASAPAPPAPPEQKWALDKRKVLVGHDSESVVTLVKDILEEAGYMAITATDGVAAMVKLEGEKPFLAILDVALPRIYGFEICDRLKNTPESSDVKVIMIASIYDKTRYKREPTDLYGADDYIEKHHIHDSLLKKVRRLSGDGPAPEANIPREESGFMPPTPEEKAKLDSEARKMREDEIRQFPAPSAADPEQVEAARRLARIILSDIALYNQSAVEEGIASGGFRELLSAELKEGRDLYDTRVAEEVRASADYFDEELGKFIEKKKRTMELGGQ